MSKNRETGQAGEKIAAEYLISKGYTVEHMNWKGESCEIDIIARQGEKWIFVEVKTRSGTGFGWPEKAVNKTKQAHIVRAADRFIYDHKIDEELRFDIISIVNTPKGHEVYHIEDAFVP